MISSPRRRPRRKRSRRLLLRAQEMQWSSLQLILRRNSLTAISTVINATKSATRRVSTLSPRSPRNPDPLCACCDPAEVISCTEVAKKCRTKYCKPCLGNRYGEDIDEIKQTPASGRGKTKMPYTFRCVSTRPCYNVILRSSSPDAQDVGESVTAAPVDGHKGSNQLGMVAPIPVSLGPYIFAQ
jgi:hypothetical protein